MTEKRQRFDVPVTEESWPVIPQPVDDGHCELCREPCDHLLSMVLPSALVCCACAQLPLTKVVSKMLERGINPQSRLVKLPDEQ